MLIRRRGAPRRGRVAVVAFEPRVDEVAGALAFRVGAVVTLAAGADDLRVIHAERRAESSRRAVGMARAAFCRRVGMQRRQAVATGTGTCAANGSWNLSVIDDNGGSPRSRCWVMAYVAIVRGRNVAIWFGVTRRTSADHLKVIHPYRRGEGARGMARLAAIRGVGVPCGPGVTAGAGAATDHLQVIYFEHRLERQRRMAGFAHVGRVDVSGILANGRSAVMAA